jgi:hypothetical protein
VTKLQFPYHLDADDVADGMPAAVMLEQIRVEPVNGHSNSSSSAITVISSSYSNNCISMSASMSPAASAASASATTLAATATWPNNTNLSWQHQLWEQEH